MPDVSLNGIEFEIKGGTEKASASIDDLVAKLDKLSTALESVVNKSGLTGVGNKAKKEIEPLDEALQDLIRNADKVEVLRGKLDGLRDSLENAFKAGNEKRAWGIQWQILSTEAALEKATAATTPLSAELQETIANASQIDILEAKLESLRAAMQRAFDAGDQEGAYKFREQILRTEASLEKARDAANKTASALKDVGNAAKKANKPLGNFLNSLKRIAMYRTLRSIIKSITQAFQEGLKNAYEFSKATWDQSGLAAALDKIASSSLQMKNQLGAAFGGLLQIITPIILTAISLITKLASAISMLFGMFSGSGGWLKATDAWTEWGEAAEGAGGAAKEALKYLAPFDELNVLPSQKQGGGGGGDMPDFGDMFEYQDIPEWIQNFADKISEFIASLKISFDDVFFQWDNLTGEQIAEKVIAGLGGLLGATVGFMIGGVPGAIVGTLVGVGISLEISSLIFDHDGVISKSEIADMVAVGLSAVCGGVIGFIAGGPGGALIGMTVGVGAWLGLKEIEFFTGTTVDLTQSLVDSLIIATGAAIGFKVGGIGGAVIGATIGVGINLSIKNFAFGDSANWTATDWATKIIETIAPAAGAMIGFAVGSVPGALIGATIGLAISFILSQDFLGGDDTTISDLAENVKRKFIDAWNKFTYDVDSIIDLVSPPLEDLLQVGKDFVEGIWSGITTTVEEIVTRFKEYIFDPIVDGIKSVFGIASPAEKMKPYGEFIAEGILEGIKNVWKDIKSWVNENLVQPFAEAVSDWSQQVSDWVNDEEWWDNVPAFYIGENVPPVQIEVVADTENLVDSINDSIQSGGEYLANVGGKMIRLFDVLTEHEKMIDTSAHMVTVIDGLHDSDKEIPTTAVYTYSADELRDDLRSIRTTARFVYADRQLSDEQRTFKSIARFVWVDRQLTDQQRTFGAIANFKWAIANLTDNQRTLWAIAKYTKANFSALTDANRTIDAWALFKGTRIADSAKDPWGRLNVDATANIKGATGLTTITLVPQANGGVFSNGAWSSIPQYAGGGRAHGSLFLAGEAGPEIVGHVGGRTEVLNSSQLAATMYAAVRSAMSGIAFRMSGISAGEETSEDNEDVMYRAFSRALADSDLGGDVNLDGNTLYRAMVTRNRQNTRLTGVNAMA